MPYEDFPWFKDQLVKFIFNVEEPSPGHFYWPDIDVDLTSESIENPKRFPLKSRSLLAKNNQLDKVLIKTLPAQLD